MGQYFCIVNLDKKTKREIGKLGESIWQGWPGDIGGFIRVLSCAQGRESSDEFKSSASSRA